MASISLGIVADNSEAGRKNFEESVGRIAKNIKPQLIIGVNEKETTAAFQTAINKALANVKIDSKNVFSASLKKEIQKISQNDISKKSGTNNGVDKQRVGIEALRKAYEELNRAQLEYERALKAKSKYGLSSFDTSSFANSKDSAEKKLSQLKSQAGLLDAEYEKIAQSASKVGSVSPIGDKSYVALKNNIVQLAQYRQQLETTGADSVAVRAKMEGLEQSVGSALQKYSLSTSQLAEVDDIFVNSSKYVAQSVDKFKTQVNDASMALSNWMSKNSNITKDEKLHVKLQALSSDFHTLSSDVSKSGIVTDEARAKFAELKSGFSELKKEAIGKGLTGKTFIDGMISAYKKFGGWTIVTRSLIAMWREAKELYNNVVLIDTAMTELRKVTNETEMVYSKFLDTAADRAKSLGATMEDVVTSTADYARLGYGIDDASEMADASLVYKNVGDGISDINEASESIISTMQAFGVETKNVMSIVDKFNAVGNNFAISSSGVGEAMKRSAAAMEAGGNTIDQTAGLIAAMNTTIQDPEKVGKMIA